jgi:hypothetical protein
MSDNQTLESYEKGSITAEKMRAAAEKIDLPNQDGRLLSPHRHDPAD